MADLSDLMPQFQALYQCSPKQVWNLATINGKIYGFPLVTNPSTDGVDESSIYIRQDVVDALHAQMPTSPEELLQLAILAKDAKLDCKIAYSAATPPYAFQRSYSSWPFFVDADSLFLYTKDNKIVTYAGSDVYKQDKSLLGSFNKAGVLSVFYRLSDAEPYEEKFRFLAALYPIQCSPSSEHAKDIRLIQFGPDKEYFPLSPLSSSFIVISSKTEDVKGCLEAIQALYTVPEIHDTFLYGVKGVDWIEHEDGRREEKNEQINAYSFEHYLVARSTYTQVQFVLDRRSRDTSKETRIDMPASNFVFEVDTDELTNLQNAVMTSYDGHDGPNGIIGLRCNAEPDGNVDDAINTMKKAGLDQLLSEYQKQYMEYLVSSDLNK